MKINVAIAEWKTSRAPEVHGLHGQVFVHGLRFRFGTWDSRPAAKSSFFRLCNCAAKINPFITNDFHMQTAQKHINCAAVQLCNTLT